MALPGELHTLDDVDAPTENPYSPGVFGKLDIAALLEDHLLEGLDTEADTAVLERIFDNIRPQSDQSFSPQLRPCRDPAKDHLLAALHAAELGHPAAYAAVQDVLLATAGVLHVGVLGLNAAAVWALWTHGLHTAAIAGVVLLTLHLPLTSALVAASASTTAPSKGKAAAPASSRHHRFTAWFVVPLYDIAVLTALLPLQRRSLSDRRRLARRLRWLPAAELWLWQYRACRQLLLVVVHSVPMAVLGLVMCIVGSCRDALQSAGGVAAAGAGAAGAGTAAAAAAGGAGMLWLLIAATAVSLLHAALGLGEAALNARWAGQISLLRYCGLALRLRGAKKLPYEWQSQLSEPRLVIRPDSSDFSDLSRPQQCQLLRLALQRPYFAIANAVTHPRPPPKASPGAQNASSAAAGAAAAAGGGSSSGGCGGCTAALAAGWKRLTAFCRADCMMPGCCKAVACCGGGSAAGGGGRRRRRSSSSSDDDDGPMGRPRAPPSACLLLQSKAAVKAVVGLLPGPLAAARGSLTGDPPQCDLSVNLVSFRDAAACKHCRALLELVVRQGLRSLVVGDAKLQLDFFGVLTAYLPSRSCVLTKLVLKDVMSSGISVLCMLCEGMAANHSVTHLDLSNNQLWGMRGARELRTMLRGSAGLRVLLLPFCNIASAGAAEIFKGVAESASLEQLDLSQNHIGDDVPDWTELLGAPGVAAVPPAGGVAAGSGGPGAGAGAGGRARNGSLREVDLSFNWVQDALAGWTAALLEVFPTLSRLHLNHNSDAASSRVASRAATPKSLTPRTLTPRSLTPSNLRVASYSVASATGLAAAAAACGGSGAPATATTAAAAPAAGLSSTSAPVGLPVSAAAAAGAQGKQAGGGGGGGSGAGVWGLQRMASSALSPCGSERHEGGQLLASGAAAAAAAGGVQ
ncbi:hypothetical protein Agub_g14680, partial [Astrephomene gubernaculifera]